MVVPADGLGIHEIEAALLARVYHVLASIPFKDCGCDLHVQVALEKPLGIGRAVIVNELDGLGRRILLDTNDAVAESV